MKSFEKSMFILLGMFMCLTFISCSDDPEIEEPDFEMSMNKTTLALEVGKSETLVVSYNPSDTPNQGHTWGSSKPEIATVDETGKVTAKAIGECTVTARSLSGNVTTTCKIQVVDKIIRVTSVSLNKTAAEIATGETLALEATILPSNATNKGVKWASSSNEVATVDAKGVVSAVAEGETTITVTTDDNSKKATCKLTVVPAGMKFSEPTIENITSNSALIVGSIESKGVKITEAGICIATTSTPTVDNGKVMLLQGGGTISTVLKELKAETTYYLRFYAIVDGKVRYGNQTVFETLPAVTISVPAFTDIMAHSATVNGTISANGSNLTETGIVYSKTSMPTIADTKVVISEEKIAYTLMELEASTTYYVRIYTVIGDKTYYGEQAELVTCDELITHFEPYEIIVTHSYMAVSCRNDIQLKSVAPKGYKTINVCYGTNPDPKITDNIAECNVSGGTCYLKLENIRIYGGGNRFYIRTYCRIGSKIEYSDDIVSIMPVHLENNKHSSIANQISFSYDRAYVGSAYHTEYEFDTFYYKNLPEGVYEVTAKRLSVDNGSTYKNKIYINGGSGSFIRRDKDQISISNIETGVIYKIICN